MTCRLSDILAPNFYDVHQELKRERISELWCAGGRGSTKSTFLSVEIFLGMIRDPNANAFVSRRYENELRDSVLGQMQWTADKLGISQFWRFTTSPIQAINMVTGQRIIFRGIDNPLKAKSIKLAKGYLKYFWAEEVDQYGGLEDIRSLLQSVFRGEGGHRVSMFSYNPPKSSRAWVNQESKKVKPGRFVHRSDYRLVPQAWLGERFIAEAEYLKDTNPSAYDHEYLGIEVGTGSEVFHNIEVRQILPDERKSFDQIYQGLDFGLSVSYTVLVRMHYDKNLRRLWIFDEIARIGISDRVLAELTPKEWKETLTVADKSGEKSINVLRAEHGFRIIKSPGDRVEFGVKWLADLEKIIIDPQTCPLAANEFVSYALDKTRSGEIIDRFPDRNNHAIDSVRYALSSVMSGPKAKVLKVGVA